MKRFSFLTACAALIMFCSCKKNNTNYTCGYPESTLIAPQSEQQALLDSLNAHNINNATKDSSGFYYTINNPGTSPGIANLCSSIAVFYRGGFFNGAGFDSTTGNPAIFQLGGVIVGWQKGIPHVNKNGDITLYLPPSLAYGAKAVLNPNTGDTVIPANSYLVFRVTVADIQ